MCFNNSGFIFTINNHLYWFIMIQKKPNLILTHNEVEVSYFKQYTATKRYLLTISNAINKSINLTAWCCVQNKLGQLSLLYKIRDWALWGIVGIVILSQFSRQGQNLYGPSLTDYSSRDCRVVPYPITLPKTSRHSKFLHSVTSSNKPVRGPVPHRLWTKKPPLTDQWPIVLDQSRFVPT